MRYDERIKESVRNALEERPSELGSWERFTRRVGRLRAKRYAFSALAAATAVAAAIVIVPRLGSDRNVTPVETPSGDMTTTPSPSVGPQPPTELVAIDAGDPQRNDDDRIVVISTATGALVRVLVTASESGSDWFIPELALSADRSTVYFVREEGNQALGSNACNWRIFSIPITGGSATLVADGHSPALSPDGRFLAYTAKGTGPNCNRNPLVVRDLATGDERRWAWDSEQPVEPYDGGAFGSSWAPDSKHLAFYRDAGDPFYEIWILDTSKVPRTLLDADKLGGPPAEGWSDPFYLSDGSIAVIHHVESVHNMPGGRQRVVSVDPITKEVRSVLVDGDGFVKAITVDGSGRFLAIVRPGGIYRVSDGNEIEITNGAYPAIDW